MFLDSKVPRDGGLLCNEQSTTLYRKTNLTRSNLLEIRWYLKGHRNWSRNIVKNIPFVDNLSFFVLQYEILKKCLKILNFF